MNVAELLIRYRKRRTPAATLVIVVCTLVALILRRPDQWTSPAVWIEEGTVALPDYIANGWSSLWHPMMGYLVLPTKVILATAATLSFRWLPEIENALAALFTIGVCAAVVFSPTMLRHRLACALALLILPTDSEVFGTSAYAFWWGSLLVILPLLWRPDAGRHTLRTTLLVVGGLSSPLVVTLTPLFVLRAILQCTRVAICDLVVAGGTAAIQASLFMKTAQAGNAAYASVTPTLFIRKFFGYFLYPPIAVGTHDVATLLVGLVFVGFLVYVSIRWRRELGPAYFFLMAAFLLAAIASVARVPIAAIHPGVAGPRYFFLPFSFLSMALVQIAVLDARMTRTALISVLTLVGRNAIDLGQRRHDPIDWRAAVAACVTSDRYDLPVHWDGHLATAWKTPVSGANCRRLVTHSWFDNTLAGGPP